MKRHGNWLVKPRAKHDLGSSSNRPDQLAGNPLMAGNGQVNAVNLDHSCRSCRVDDPVSYHGPDVAPVKLPDDLSDIGLPGFGGDHSAAMQASLEIVSAKIQDNEGRAFRHRTVEARQHSASGISAYSGIHDMNAPAFGLKHVLQTRGPCLRRGDAFSLRVAGAKGDNLRQGRIRRDATERDQDQGEKATLTWIHDLPLWHSNSDLKVAAI